MGFKYIVIEVERPTGVQRLPIIFPDVLVHDEVAAVIRVLPTFERTTDSRVTSAGDVRIDAFCSGKSSTLKLESDEGDTELINTFPYCLGLII